MYVTNKYCAFGWCKKRGVGLPIYVVRTCYTGWSESLCAPDDCVVIIRCTETFWSPCIMFVTLCHWKCSGDRGPQMLSSRADVGQPCRSTCKLRSRSEKCPPLCGKLFIAVFTLLRFLSVHIFTRHFSEVTLISSSHPLRLSGWIFLCTSYFLPACYMLSCYPLIFFINVLITHLCLSPCCIPLEVRMFWSALSSRRLQLVTGLWPEPTIKTISTCTPTSTYIIAGVILN